MMPAKMRRLRELEQENARLKKRGGSDARQGDAAGRHQAKALRPGRKRALVDAMRHVDQNGSLVSQQGYDADQLVQLEGLFRADLNDDGDVGAVQLIESNGVYDLLIDASGAYRIDDGNGVQIGLSGGGKFNLGPNSFPGWMALQAEAEGSNGFAVLWHNNSVGYRLWHVDQNGAIVSQQSYGADELVQLEGLFQPISMTRRL